MLREFAVAAICALALPGLVAATVPTRQQREAVVSDRALKIRPPAAAGYHSFRDAHGSALSTSSVAALGQ